MMREETRKFLHDHLFTESDPEIDFEELGLVLEAFADERIKAAYNEGFNQGKYDPDFEDEPDSFATHLRKNR